MFEKRFRSNKHVGIFATRPIASGTRLFSHADWVEDEIRGWDRLTVEELEGLNPAQRHQYLRYAYDLDFGLMIGTFDWGRAQHLSNFMNHSCNPSMVYGFEDDIVAARDISVGEELTVDYGSFIVNVDQDFRCGCGSPNCRGQVRKDDWHWLADTPGVGFPTFVRAVLPQRSSTRSRFLRGRAS